MPPQGIASASDSDWVRWETGIVELRLDPRRGNLDRFSFVCVGLEIVRVFRVDHRTDRRCDLFVDKGVFHVSSG